MRSYTILFTPSIYTNLQETLSAEEYEKLSSISTCKHEIYTTAIGKIKKMSQEVFHPEVAFLNSLVLSDGYTPSLWVEDVIKRNKASKVALEAVRNNVNDVELLQTALDAEMTCLNNLISPSKKAMKLFRQIEKTLLIALLDSKSTTESLGGVKGQIFRGKNSEIDELGGNILLVVEILGQSFLGSSGMQENPLFRKMQN